MQIEWNGVKSTSPVDSPAEAVVTIPTGRAASSSAPTPPPDVNHRPVMRLRWDFRTRFPEVLPEVVDAGVMAAEDAAPESVEAIHQEHGRKMLDTLAELDAANDERRIASSKQASPKSDRLDKPTRLERWYASLLGVYEDWFGKEAADAFDRTVRAWHAHIEVVVDRESPTSSDATPIPSIALPQSDWQSPDLPAVTIDLLPSAPLLPLISPTRQLPDLTTRRIIARLPVPKPLPAAVLASHFGTDERGKPINPSADEVYAITNEHAEKLIDLIQSLPAPGRPGRSAIEDQITAGIAKYAGDFGEHAAQRLEAHCRRQVRLQETSGLPRSR
jgi:hypothetical protein